MDMLETALGRYVPANESQTVLEDAILRLLFRYRMSQQNPHNAPMKLSDIVRAVLEVPQLVVAALDGLTEQAPPLVEESTPLQSGRTFRITGAGMRFVGNLPHGMDGLR